MGSKVYVEKLKDQMRYKAIGRKVVENRDSFVLKERQQTYQSKSDKAIRVQPEDNTFYWQNGTGAKPDSNMSLEGSMYYRYSTTIGQIYKNYIYGIYINIIYLHFIKPVLSVKFIF